MNTFTLGVSSERKGVLLASEGSPLEAEGVLNPGVARDRSGVLLLYPRMVAAGNISRIGIVRGDESRDSTRYERLGYVLEPERAYERREHPGYGCEDARVTFVAMLDRYLMTYTAYGPAGPRIAIAISDDAYTWRRLGLVRFAEAKLDARGNKDAAFFPEPVQSPGGVPSFAMYHRPMLASAVNGQTPIPVILALEPADRESTCIAYFPIERVRRDESALCFPDESVKVLAVDAPWGRLKNGAGTPPVKTSAGWMSFFHGVDAIDRDGVASLYDTAGIVIHDADRPDIIRYRSPEPVLGPRTAEERFGIVDDVVFPTGIDERPDGSYDVYYGAADAKVALANFRIAFPDVAGAEVHIKHEHSAKMSH
ncbi:MAG: glycosidase [Candidatus Velthaea sp.]